MEDRQRPKLTSELYQECQEWLARNKARLDQKKKMWEDQYPLRHPKDNERRLHDLEALEFAISVHEHELTEMASTTVPNAERDVLCECGHNLGQHPPDASRPFAWPCRACDCSEYREVRG